jgi:hypothetical protein
MEVEIDLKSYANAGKFWTNAQVNLSEKTTLMYFPTTRENSRDHSPGGSSKVA